MCDTQTLKAHVPTERVKPKRFMEPPAYRNLLKLFCAINLWPFFGLRTKNHLPEEYTLKLLRVRVLAAAARPC